MELRWKVSADMGSVFTLKEASCSLLDWLLFLLDMKLGFAEVGRALPGLFIPTGSGIGSRE